MLGRQLGAGAREQQQQQKAVEEGEGLAGCRPSERREGDAGRERVFVALGRGHRHGDRVACGLQEGHILCRALGTVDGRACVVQEDNGKEASTVHSDYKLHEQGACDRIRSRSRG